MAGMAEDNRLSASMSDSVSSGAMSRSSRVYAVATKTYISDRAKNRLRQYIFPPLSMRKPFESTLNASEPKMSGLVWS